MYDGEITTLSESIKFYSGLNLPPIPVLPEKWQVYAGIPGRFSPEWVAGLCRNRWQV
ncbi:MAG: hypothetical protein KAQ69_11730 [Spirochaetales bacterium]|nr:hypothetical protein [Spirochaetales bacterium]